MNIAQPLDAKTKNGINIYVYNEMSGDVIDVVGVDANRVLHRN